MIKWKKTEADMSGRNQVQATGSKGRQDLLKFDPEDLTIIEDPKHHLYDPRCKLPLDENLVLNIMMNGIIQPINVRRNGERDGKSIIEVVAGRQRVRHAREANKRLLAEGKTPILVPAVIRRGDDLNLFGVMISENEIRRDDAVMVKAKKVSRYMDMGADIEQAAHTFGVTTKSIRNWLALLDCSKGVQDAVDAGKITPSLAISEFSKLPREEQDEALAKVLAQGTVKGKKGKENVRAARSGGESVEQAVRMVSRKRIELAAEAIKYGKGDYRDGFRAALDWILSNKPRHFAEVKADLIEAGAIDE